MRDAFLDLEVPRIGCFLMWAEGVQVRRLTQVAHLDARSASRIDGSLEDLMRSQFPFVLLNGKNRIRPFRELLRIRILGHHHRTGSSIPRSCW